VTLPTLTTYPADAPLIRYSVESTGAGTPFVETWKVRVSEEYARAVPRTTARSIEDLPRPTSDARVRAWLRNLGVYRTPTQAINAERAYAARRRREAEDEASTMTARLARLAALR
jgi:hypothetical protein